MATPEKREEKPTEKPAEKPGAKLAEKRVEAHGKSFGKADLGPYPWPPEGMPKEEAILQPDGETIAYEQRKRSDVYDALGVKDLEALLDERDEEGHPLYGVAAPFPAAPGPSSGARQAPTTPIAA